MPPRFGLRFRLALATAGGLCSLVGGAAEGELVVTVEERVFKVEAYAVLGSRVRLELPGGGVLTLPLARIERVIDDEIAAAAPGPDEPPAPPGSARLAAGEPVPETPFGALIYETAERHGMSPTLVAAMVRAESAFDPRAVSHKGARGLMQLMPATAHRFGVESARLFDPAANLEAGVRYLKWLDGRFAGDLPRVLAAYNAGEGAVERHGGVPPYRETRQYVARIYATLGLPARVSASLGGPSAPPR